MPPASGGDRCAAAERQPILRAFARGSLNAPLTHAGPRRTITRIRRAPRMQWSLRDVQPAITLTDAWRRTAIWTARRDLLNSSGDAEEFVAEIDNDGAVTIRFGDDVHGRRPEPGTTSLPGIASATAAPATSAPIR